MAKPAETGDEKLSPYFDSPDNTKSLQDAGSSLQIKIISPEK
jgi:hypothetical protein